ncbi:hypothetical protein [Chelatococcus asaccharovorans]|uniref:hypothetical protein n=1 Tax=Chelatococcus asaccharovorans TaxID=28210 RepID=UPI00224C6FE5|nr:hypothetical protein [Chelatococcus asaccharovorans]CAH1671938.1 hypothetical protein CHELA17_61310 [Chelatococcus asaccharovorans]CAH1676655.1 hypothetical protein CHELA40_14312 [Chelatococcus asaccharovorans]
MHCNRTGAIALSAWEVERDEDGSFTLFLVGADGQCPLAICPVVGIEWRLTPEQVAALAAAFAVPIAETVGVGQSPYLAN